MRAQSIRRKLAVILATDMVGYSRLMEADEAGTLTQLKALRADLIDPKIEAYRGRIFKTTGDGLLVEFASVADAVRCAVEIQNAMDERYAGVSDDRRIQFRMGINLGEIIIEGDDIYGNGVNVAARLEGLAKPGGICISGTVHEQIESILAFGYDDMGEQKVKNISKPIRSFAVRFNGAGPEKEDKEDNVIFYVIGRDETADIVLADETISNFHAELVVTEDQEFYLTDRKSRNGTVISRDGKWVPLTQGFVEGDQQIMLGRYATTARKLLRLVDANRSTGSDGPRNGKKDAAKRPAGGRAEPFDGRVQRDPETGYIVKQK